MRSNAAIPDLFRALAFTAATLVCGASARAQCPDWQTGFQAPGIGGYVQAFTVHADGSGQRVLVIGGDRLQLPGVPFLGTAVLTWDGATLQALGSLPPYSSVHALLSWDDGSGPAIYAGGLFPSSPLLGIVRWNGASWENVGGGTNGRVRALELFDDGTGRALYAGGEFTLAGGVTVRRVARWNGNAWTPVGTGTTDGPNATVHALTVWQDGSADPPALYAGGEFTGVGTSAANRIAKWNGTSWLALGSGVNGLVTSLAAYDCGAGTALYAGGFFSTAGGSPAQGIAGYDGTWFAVGSPSLRGPSPSVMALEVGDLGSGPQLYATGSFGTAGGILVEGSASWDGSQWHPLGAGASGVALASHDDGSGPAIYCGGSFDFAGDVPSRGVGRWDGNQWSSLRNGDGLIGHVFASTVHDDGTGRALYVGGTLFSAGSTIVRNLARFDGSTWSPVGTGANEIVYALLSHDDGSGPALYAGGHFGEIGGVQTHALARWNGSAWAQVGATGFPPSTYVFALAEFDDGTGKALYAAGSFTQAGGVPAQHVAKWDGSMWAALGSGLGQQALALAAHDDGSGLALYVGGSFTTAGGGPATGIARWNGSAWSPVGAGVGGSNAYVSALLSFDDGTESALYVGGHFTQAGGPAGGIARWNGIAYDPLGGGILAPYVVHELAAFDEGTGGGPKLFAGGFYTTMSGMAANGIARFDGGSWSAVGGESGADINALQVHDAGLGAGPVLYVMGRFGAAGLTISDGIAAWSSCGETGRTLCFGDGSGAACPCGNASVPGDRDGCLNSTGLGGRLRASGQPSLAHDTLVLSGSRMTNGSALYFQGTTRVSGGAGAVFGDGLRCAAGTVVRLAVVANSGGGSQYPRAGDPPVATQGAVAQPGVREYQVWFRDAASFCTPDTFALTNAVEIVWGL